MMVKKEKQPISFLSVFRENFYRKVVFAAILVVLVVFFVNNFNVVGNFIHKILSILMPVIIGFVLTYIMLPLYNVVVKLITKRIDVEEVDHRKRAIFARAVATLICAITVILIAAGLAFLLVPQLVASVTKFATKVKDYAVIVRNFGDNLKENANIVFVNDIIDEVETQINELMNMKDTLNKVEYGKIFTSVFNGFKVSLKMCLNVIVGFIVMLYALNMKVEFSVGAKKLLYALFDKPVADHILVEVRFANKIFSGFLVGKIIDSIIIGVICYIVCLILGMPYTPIIAVVVGITNIIPFFGPFIGAIPCFILVFLDEPFSFKPWIFLIFIILLQQLDGNVIGPKILGDRTGVGSFWVLFSILLFGGLFGFVGMMIAVPMWAIIQRLGDEYVLKRLKDKSYKLTDSDNKKLEKYVLDVSSVK